jgi:hypothetical protein
MYQGCLGVSGVYIRCSRAAFLGIFSFVGGLNCQWLLVLPVSFITGCGEGTMCT